MGILCPSLFIFIHQINFKSEQSVTSSFDHASDDCNRRRGALLLRVSVGDYNPHRKTEWNPPPTEAGDIGDLVIHQFYS